MTLSDGALPDEVLVAVLRPHGRRCQGREVSQRWRRAVDGHFGVCRFPPPGGRKFCLDLEIDKGMSNDMFCAQFSGRGEAGTWQGHVGYLNWCPVYYRSAPGAHRDVRHALGEADICGLWRRVARLLEERAVPRTSRPGGEGWSVTLEDGGHLYVTQFRCDGEDAGQRHEVGRLTAAETADLLSILDHRRNVAATTMPREA